MQSNSTDQIEELLFGRAVNLRIGEPGQLRFIIGHDTHVFDPSCVCLKDGRRQDSSTHVASLTIIIEAGFNAILANAPASLQWWVQDFCG